jgi:hypothetical protein
MPTSSGRALVGAALLCLTLLPIPATAQVATDSAKRSATPAPDSQAVGYGDSTRQSGVDTSRIPPAADSARLGGRDSASASAAPAAPIPVDSVLSSACSSVRAGTVAPGLVLIVFRDGATSEERSAAVAGAGGTSAGTAPTGGEYVRAAESASARDLADQLVLNPAVASVSERSCPVTGRH